MYQKLNLILNTSLLCLIVSCATSAGMVVVKSEPSGAQVFVVDPKSGQSALIGETPLGFKRAERITPGSDVIQLRIEKDGFQSKVPAVAAFGGGTTYLQVQLSPAVVAKGEIRDSFEKARAHVSNMNRLVVTTRYSEALSEAERIIELDPKNAEAHAAKGSILYLMKDVDNARVSWSKALELNPNFESVRNSLIELNIDSNNRQPSRERSSNEN